MKKDERINFKLSVEQKELVEYALTLSSYKNLTEFVVASAISESIKIIEENKSILQTIEDKRIFVDALINPSTSNPKFKQAMLRMKALSWWFKLSIIDRSLLCQKYSEELKGKGSVSVNELEIISMYKDEKEKPNN